jgi:hypothetical protein
MVEKMVHKIVQMLANVARKEIEEASMVVDTKGIRKEVAKTTTYALCCWKGWPKEPPSQAKFDSNFNIGEDLGIEIATSYLARVPTRITRERLQVKLGVVRLANSSHVFFVAHGDSSRVFLRRVLLDIGAR